MRAILFLMLAACTDDEPWCEPIIEYIGGPGPANEGCPALQFVDERFPQVWFPVDVRARVRECQDNSFAWRIFECRREGWYELFVPNYYEGKLTAR